jgi:peroxiredoxin
MKAFILIISLALFKLSAYAQTSLKGRIAAAPKDQVFLMQHLGFDLKKISTAILDASGNFYFTIPREIPIIKGFYRLQFNDTIFADLVLSPDEKIFIKTDAFWMQDSLKVENSPENDAFMKMRDLQLRFFEKIKLVQAEYSQVNANDTAAFKKRKEIEEKYENLQKDHNRKLDTFAATYGNTFSGRLAKMEKIPIFSDFPSEKDKYKNANEFLLEHYFDYVDFSMPELILGSDIFDKYIVYLEQYPPKTMEGFKKGIDFILKKTFINPSLYKESVRLLAENFEVRGPEEIFLYIVDTYTESCESEGEFKDVQKGRDKLLSLSAGKIAPDIEMPDSSGKMIKLSSLLSGHKLVLLIFWASWCDHCQQLMPQIAYFYRDFKEKGLEVYAVSLDNERKDWISFIRQNRMNWVNVCDFKKWDSPIVSDYFVKKTPQYYLLNEEGLILGKNMSVSKLQGSLEHFLNH